MVLGQQNNGALSYAQLESIWIQAGGNPNLAPLMAAIAEAESSGIPSKQNDVDNNGTQSSFGLWQISTGTHVPPDPNWSDPLTNGKLAVAKLNKQGLTAWGTYDSGAYKAFMQGGTTPDNSWQNGWGGGATFGGQGIAGNTAGTSSDTCLMNISYGVGSACLMSKTNARALIGGLLFAGSIMLFTAGSIVLVSAGFRKTVAPALGAVTKGPVGMITRAAAKTSNKPTMQAKTVSKSK